jgi:hypothetical protein
MSNLLRAARSSRWLFACALALSGCSDPPLLAPDAEAYDAGREPDAGPTFEDGGGIGITGLSLARVVPAHGPFLGGNTVVLRGSGYTENSTVTFGGRAVQPADHRLIDDRRLSVVVPAGEVGLVDVTVTEGDETVTLEDGYNYDAIYIDPSSGAVSGGTFVSIVGSGTNFREGDTVVFGRTPCVDVEVVSPNRITCRTPPMSAGSVDVTVTSSADGSSITAPDGYTYFDTSDPFAGGLGGGPVANAINLTVIDAVTGAAVEGAYAILGEDQTTMYQGYTDSLGQYTFSGPDLTIPATIHVAKVCYESTSFVAFDARDVTVFLYPRTFFNTVIPEECMSMGTGGGGGRGRNGAFIEGELVWPTDMAEQTWNNLPEARPGWVRVAYVYTTQAYVEYANPYDPTFNGARQRVTESPRGDRGGFPYSIYSRAAGLAVYALAGLEESPAPPPPQQARFIPYVMGVTRNLLTAPGETLTNIDILMTIPLDHYLDVEITDLPAEVATGPDRFRMSSYIDLGGEGVIVRRVRGEQLDVVRGRDSTRSFRFGALPALEEQLSDGRYRVDVGWYTGDFEWVPDTVQVLRGIVDVDEPLQVSGFLGIPDALAPRFGEMLPADRVLRWQALGDEADFQYVYILDSGGNAVWIQYVPGDVFETPIPDLSAAEGVWDIPEGFMTWGVVGVRRPGFDFDEFRYTDLTTIYWSAWAENEFTAQR